MANVARRGVSGRGSGAARSRRAASAPPGDGTSTSPGPPSPARRMAAAGDPFLTTVHYRHPRWNARAVPIGPPLRPRPPLLDELRQLGAVLLALGRAPVVVLDGAAGRFRPALLGALVAALLPPRIRPTVVVAGEMWQRDEGVRGWVQRLVVRGAVAGAARFTVPTEAERAFLRDVWGIPLAKSRCVPFFATLDEDLAVVPPDVGYVFAGGDTHRDFVPLLEAARRFPRQRFVVATRSLPRGAVPPPNVEVVQHDLPGFVEAMRGAVVVVVPLRTGLKRSTGLIALLNAMRLARPVVVTDAVGIREYAGTGAGPIVVDGTAAGYEEAIGYLLDPAHAADRRRLGLAGRSAVTRFTFDAHVDALLAVVDEAVAERRAPQGGSPTAPDHW